MRMRRTVRGVTAWAVVASVIVFVGPSASSVDASSGCVDASDASETALAIVRRIPVGSDPASVAVDDADDLVYVTNQSDSSVSVIDGDSGAVTETIVVGALPEGVAVNQTTNLVYVANAGDETVSVIDPTTLEVSETIVLGVLDPQSGFFSPLGVAVHEASNRIFVTSNSDLFPDHPKPTGVTVINGENSTVSARIPLTDNPTRIAIDQQTGGKVYVALSNSVTFGHGEIAVIDPVTLTPEPSISVSPFPQGLVVDESDDLLYVSTQYALSGDFSKFDLSDSSLETIPLPDTQSGIALDRSDGTMYITNTGVMSDPVPGNVSVVRDMTVIATLIGFDSPRGVAVDQAGDHRGVVYVANRGGESLAVLAEATVSASSSSTRSTLNLTLDIPQVSYDADDSTVELVCFDRTPGTRLRAGDDDTWTVKAPSGSGTVPVSVRLAGGQWIDAGTFTLHPRTSSTVKRFGVDPAGGVCRMRGVEHSRPWAMRVAKNAYLPGPSDCARAGYTFGGWALASSPTIVLPLPLIVDPSDGVKRYVTSGGDDLVAVWSTTPSPPAPVSAFVAFANFFCDRCTSVWLIWPTPIEQETANRVVITDAAGRELCAQGVVGIGQWTACVVSGLTPGQTYSYRNVVTNGTSSSAPVSVQVTLSNRS